MRRKLLPTAYCLLPTAYCLLLTAYCLPLTAYCLPLTAYCLPFTAYCLLHPSSDTHRRSTTPHERSREPTPAAARHVRFARDTRAPLSASHSDTPRARGVFRRDRGRRSAHPRRRWLSRAGTSSAPTAFAPGLPPFPGTCSSLR